MLPRQVLIFLPLGAKYSDGEQGYRLQYSDSLRVGPSADRTPVKAKLSAPSRPALGPLSLLYNGYRVITGTAAWR